MEFLINSCHVPPDNVDSDIFEEKRYSGTYELASIAGIDDDEYFYLCTSPVYRCLGIYRFVNSKLELQDELLTLNKDRLECEKYEIICSWKTPHCSLIMEHVSELFKNNIVEQNFFYFQTDESAIECIDKIVSIYTNK